MKLDKLRKQLRKPREPKRAPKDTRGDSTASQSPNNAPGRKIKLQCKACDRWDTRTVHRCEPDLVIDDAEDGLAFVTLGEWWCIGCGAHHITKLSP